MPRPTQANRGDPLSARKFNRVKNDAYTGATPSVGTGLESHRASHGVAIALTPSAAQVAGATACTLTSAADGPLYGVVEVYESASGYYGPEIGQCRRPSHYGFGWLGVLLEGVKQGNSALVQRRGVTPVLYTGTVAIGDTLGCVKDSYYAAPHDGGPFIVRGLPAIGVAIVEITNLRLDAKMVDCDAIDASVSGPYHTIIYKGRAIAITSPGITVTT